MARSQLPAVIGEAIPELVLDTGGPGRFAWEEYFSAEIRNPHTRRAYRHAVRRARHWPAKAAARGTRRSHHHRRLLIEP
jgi:hypothetical protein